MENILNQIRNEPRSAKILELVRERLNHDPSHHLDHLLRVAHWTLQLAPAQLSRDLILCTALLHDIVYVPKNSPDRSRASELAAQEASLILKEHGFTPGEITEATLAIRDHSFSRGARPETELGKALQDADRLDALGAIGILRTAAVGAVLGGVFYHPEDPWAAERPLNDHAYSIDHFFTKLLKLPELMCTPTGRVEAEKRRDFMLKFLDQLGVEIGNPRSTH